MCSVYPLLAFSKPAADNFENIWAEEQELEEDTVESLDSESTLAAIHLEADAAVSSLLSKQDF